MGLVVPGIVYDNAGAGEMPGIAGDERNVVNARSRRNEKVCRIACPASRAQFSREVKPSDQNLGGQRQRAVAECIDDLGVDPFGKTVAFCLFLDGRRAFAQLRQSDNTDRCIGGRLGRDPIHDPGVGLFSHTFGDNIGNKQPLHDSSLSKKVSSKISGRLSRNDIPSPRSNSIPSVTPRYFFDRSMKPASVASCGRLARISNRSGSTTTTASLPWTVTLCGFPARARRTTSENRAFASCNFHIFTSAIAR